MDVRRHNLSITTSPGELRVDAVTLAETLVALRDGLRRVVRLVVDGSSTRPGPKPGWLEDMTRYDVLGLEHGSARLPIESRTFGAIEREMWDTPLAELSSMLVADLSAVDLFGRALDDAVHARTESELLDRGVLDACVRLARAGRQQMHAVTLEGVAGVEHPVSVWFDQAEALEAMRDETPPPQALWSRAPRGRTQPRSVYRSEAQDAHSGVAAFFGIWPGDESDGELLDELRSIG